jgi:hypothetical protein
MKRFLVSERRQLSRNTMTLPTSEYELNNELKLDEIDPKMTVEYSSSIVAKPSWDMQFVCRGNNLIQIEFFQPPTIYLYDKSTLELKRSQNFPNSSHLHIAQDYSCIAYTDKFFDLLILDPDTLKIVERIGLSEFGCFGPDTSFTQIKLANRSIGMFQTYDTLRDIDCAYWVDLATKKVISERQWTDSLDLTESHSIEQEYNLVRIFSRLSGAEKTLERLHDHREPILYPAALALSATEFAILDGPFVSYYDAQNDIESDSVFRRSLPVTNTLRFGPLMILCTPRSIHYYRIDGKNLHDYAEWMLPAEIQHAKWYEVRFALDENGDIYVLFQRVVKKLFKLSVPV